MIGVSCFFIIIKGIVFGDEKCGKWLTSIFASILTSVFLTQPLQVAFVTTFFVLLFRKSNDDQDFEYDHCDDGKPINRLRMPQWYNNKMKKKYPRIEHCLMNNLAKLDQQTIEEYKRKKEREKKAKNTLREIFLYLIFIWIVFIISFDKRDVRMFQYKTSLNKLFELDGSCKSEMCFNQVKIEAFFLFQSVRFLILSLFL